MSIEISELHLENPLAVGRIDPTDGLGIARARRLHAAVYLKEGYVDPADIDLNGFLREEVDPFVERSEYFLAEHRGGEVTARQIRAEGKEGILSLPTLKNFECESDVVKKVAGVERLVDLKPSEVVEISALASTNGGAVDLYVQMLRRSIEVGHKLWVVGTDERLTRKLYGLLGEDLFHRMGEGQHWMGSQTDPMCLNPQEVVKEFLTSEDPAREPYKEIIVKGFEGIDTTTLTPELRQVLVDAGITTIDQGKLRALWESRKPEFVAAASLIGYTALRAAPVGQIEEFHGNPWVFFGIDAGTALPYTAGMSWMLRARNSIVKKVMGTALASSSFAAPYAYLWANGENYPGYVNGAIGGFVALGVAKEALTRRIQGRREQRLTDGLLASGRANEAA